MKDTDINKAYRMDKEEFAFGYEFVKKAPSVKSNYAKGYKRRKATVAGNEDVRKGLEFANTAGKSRLKKASLNIPLHVSPDSRNQGMRSS